MNVSALKQYRATQEEVLRAELAQLQRAVDEAKERMRRLEATALENVQAYLARAKEGLTADEAVLWNDLMARMADSVSRASDAVVQAQQQFEAKRLEAMDAARETRKIEVLEQREAERERHLDEVRTQRQVDEVAGRRFLVRRKESHGTSERS